MSDAEGALVDVQAMVRAVGPITIPGGVDEFAKSLSARWSSVLRMHRRAWQADSDWSWLPCASESIPWYRLGRRLADTTIRPSRFLPYAVGDYYLQDAGSLLALAVSQADGDQWKGKTVCDLCAAPGGKASALVEAVGEDGFVLANEPIRSRLASLKYNLARTGADRYAISSMDPGPLADQLGGQFDLVVVDAPCSGQALMSRGRQSESSMSAKQIQHSAQRQNRILDAALRLTKPGGKIVYSTCTFAHEENELQIQRLIDRGDAQPDPLDHLVAYQSETACYRLWPQLHRCAGAFAGAIINQTSGDEVTQQRRRKRRQSSTKSDQKIEEEALAWFVSDFRDRVKMQINGAVMFGYPVDTPWWVEGVAVAGPELAYRTGKTWKPSHQAAMRQERFVVAQKNVSLSAEQAAAFVVGNAVNLGDASGDKNGMGSETKGWAVACYQERPLGWIKSDGRIGKNHLPVSARMAGEVRS